MTIGTVVGFTIGTVVGFTMLGINAGHGYNADAEDCIAIGKTFECMTQPFENDDAWYAIVKHENGKLLFCRFIEQPPKRGLAAKRGDKTVFLPFDEPVTIKDPLNEGAQSGAAQQHGVCKDLKVDVWPGKNGEYFIAIRINGIIYLVRCKEAAQKKKMPASKEFRDLI